MIQINPLQSYIDGGARAAITSPPSASLVFDLPGRAIWVKGVKLKGTDHTYTFSHDTYISITNTPGSNESEDIKIGINTTLLKLAIDTTYGVVSASVDGLAPKFSNTNKATASAATTYNFLGIAGSTLKWYQLPWRNVRINTESTDVLGVNNTDPLIISSGTGIEVSWDSTNKRIVITNTKPDVNHNTDFQVSQIITSTNNDYRVLLKRNANNDDETGTIRYASTLLYNPSTKILKVNGNRVVTFADLYVGATSSAAGTEGLVPAASSANRNKFLRGDGTWQVPTNDNTWRPVKVEGTQKLASTTDTDALDFHGDTGIEITYDATNKKINIKNTAPDVNHNTHYTTTMYVGESNDTRANAAVNSNPYLKLFDDAARRSTLRFVAGTGITIKSDASGNITITNASPDVNHNTDRTGVKLGTVSGTKKTDSTVIINNSATGLTFQGGTNLFKIGDGTNYIEVPVTPSFTVTDKAANILTSATTLATINGTDITAKVAVVDSSPTLTTSLKTIATIAGVEIKAKITNYNTDENVKQTPKTDNVNRPLMMINGGTSAGEQTSTSMFSTGIYANASTKMITANGFVKTGSDDTSVLLAGGGAKALSDFAMSDAYVKKAGDTMSGHLKMGGTKNLASSWDTGIIAGADGHDKVVLTYLESSTSGAVIAAHNSNLTAWAPLNVSGTALIFRYLETEKMRMTNVGLGIGCTPSVPLEVTNSASSDTARIVNNTAAATYLPTLNIVAANITNGGIPYLRIGKAASSKNSGWMGFYWTANSSNSNYLGFGIDSISPAILAITGALNVGIGNVTPSYKLDVTGSNIRINGTTTEVGYLINNACESDCFGVLRNAYNGTFWGAIHFFNTAYGGYSWNEKCINIDPYSGNAVSIGNWTNPAIYVKRSNGFVGMGTTAPAYKLHIVSNTADVSPALLIESSNNTTWHYTIETLVSSLAQGQKAHIGIGKQHAQYDEAHFGYEHYADSSTSNRIYIRFYSSPTDPFTILANGKVGINVVSPTEILHVNGGNILQAGKNSWLNPARTQIGRPDSTAYTDRACIGVTNGDLHIDPYPNYGLYLRYYNHGTIYLSGSTYSISSEGAYYNGTSAYINMHRPVAENNATWNEKFGVCYSNSCSADGADGYILSMGTDNYYAQLYIDVDLTYKMALRLKTKTSAWNSWVPIITGNNISNYYWANIPIQSGTDSTKVPTFGDIVVKGVGEDKGLKLYNSDDTYNVIRFYNKSNTNVGYIHYFYNYYASSYPLSGVKTLNISGDSSTKISLGNWTSPTMLILSGGNLYVGIRLGLTAPSYPLHVNGDTYINGMGHFKHPSASQTINIGYNAATWGGDASSHPMIWGGDGTSYYTMIAMPHIPYLKNGTNGYTSSAHLGAIIRFASNASASAYWDIGCSAEDLFEIKRSGSRFVAVTNGGNVGIGTYSPSYKLDVIGSSTSGIDFHIRNTNNGTNAYTILRIGNDSNETCGVMFINGSARTTDGGAKTFTIRNDAGVLRLGNASYETRILGSYTKVLGRLRVGYNSNIADDTCTYSWLNAALTVPSIEIINKEGTDDAQRPTLTLHHYGYGGPTLSSSKGELYIEGGTTSGALSGGGVNGYFKRLHIYPNQSDGVYVYNSDYCLTSSGTTERHLRMNINSSITDFGVNGNDSFIWDRSTTRNIQFGTKSTSRMIITAAGEVKIGSEVNHNFLHVYGRHSNTGLTQDSNDRPAIYITGYYPLMMLMAGGAGNSNHGATISIGAFDSGSSGAFSAFTLGCPGQSVSKLELGFGNNSNPHYHGMNNLTSGTGVRILLINKDKTVTFYGNVYAPHYYESSDIRLKHDISSISQSIRKFRFNNDNKLYYGFIAQELETLHPELVDSSGEYKTVNYNSAICYYIGLLENRVKELEEKLQKLENIN